MQNHGFKDWVRKITLVCDLIYSRGSLHKPEKMLPQVHWYTVPS